MKIWIDVANSPQVAFVLPIIKILEKGGHEVIITARPHANTEQLLRQKNIRFQSIGGHYGKSKFAKLFGLFNRSWKLYAYLRTEDVDWALSQSSFYSPVVSFFLGVNSIYTNDNEYALGNYLAAFFANKCYFPKSWPDSFLKRMRKTNLYDGVKESVYMSESNVMRLKTDRIYYRPEAWDAQYYAGVESKKIECILTVLSTIALVVVLPRSESQVEYFMSLQMPNISVQEEPLTLDEIISNAMLFVGSGGSMSRELALTQVPTITCYEHGLLSVDKLLIEAKLLHFVPLSLFEDSFVLAVIAQLKQVDLDVFFLQGDAFRDELISTMGEFV